MLALAVQVELTPGAVIAERYRLEHLLGEGGMGAVWAATHVLTRKHVALKFLKNAAAERPDVIRRFLREARAASAVRHPSVVQIHDVLQLEDGLPVMVMDLLVGESLGAKLAREGSIPLPELARILVPLISAVGTAHAVGIVHRDLKPDNLFLVHRPDGAIEPVVLDFGIAKLTADEGDAAKTAGLTQTGSMLGTPYYMAPEQAFGEKGLDQRADVWAMGVILYQCLTGRRPVTGENLGQLFRVLMSGNIVPIREVATHLPADVCALVDRMMVTDRERRMPDLREALAVLKRYTDVAGQTFDAPSAPLQDAASAALPPGAAPTGAAPAPTDGPPSSTLPAGSPGLSAASSGVAARSASASFPGAPGSLPGASASLPGASASLPGASASLPGASASLPGPPASSTDLPSTGAPIATSTAPAVPPRPGRRAPLLVAGAAVALAAGGLAAFALSGPAPVDAAPESAASSAPAAVTVAPAPLESAAPAASSSAPKAAPAPSAALPAASTAPAAPTPGKLPGRPEPAAKTAAPTPTAAPTASERKQLPGGVVGDVPF